MAKVIIKRLGKIGTGRRRSGVTEKQVRQSNGVQCSYFTLNAKSPTFDNDLTYVFAKNVAEARKENRRLFGSADGTSTGQVGSKNAKSNHSKKVTLSDSANGARKN